MSEDPVLVSRWSADAARWMVRPLVARLLYILPLTVLAGLEMFRRVDHALYLVAMRENGPAEWAQVLGFSVAASACVVAAWRFGRSRAVAPAALYTLAALGLCFVVGEELAWGQMIIGFETPTEIARWNTKGEFSVHNLSSVERWFNAAKFLVGLYGGFGFLLMSGRLSARLPSWFDLVVIPSFLSSTFGLVSVLRWMRWMRWVHGGVGEYEEMFIAFGAAVFVILVSRRLRLDSSTGKISTAFAARR